MLFLFKITFVPLQAKAANSDTSSHFRFEICKKLGQGTYGKVQLGINKETGQQVTRKQLHKASKRVGSTKHETA